MWGDGPQNRTCPPGQRVPAAASVRLKGRVLSPDWEVVLTESKSSSNPHTGSKFEVHVQGKRGWSCVKQG